MRIQGVPYRTIWLDETQTLRIIDQTVLPHRLEILALQTCADAALAIKTMQVRGAPLIGVCAAFGVALALREDQSDAAMSRACQTLAATRPTAVNLQWALTQMHNAIAPLQPQARAAAAMSKAMAIAEVDVADNEAIGRNGLSVLREAAARAHGRRLNILTHCNAGWLATVDWGTALAPIYAAQRAGINLHVFVDETRPRNQGASLTAFELMGENIPHTVIVDNAGGHLMQRGEIDLVLVGADRISARGDVCNKIGTYLKALASFDNNVPFYVAAPLSTVDFALMDGVHETPIEERSADEVVYISGMDDLGVVTRVRLTPEGCPARNPAFDVTPSRLVSALITNRGVLTPSQGSFAVSLAAFKP